MPQAVRQWWIDVRCIYPQNLIFNSNNSQIISQTNNTIDRDGRHNNQLHVALQQHRSNTAINRFERLPLQLKQSTRRSIVISTQWNSLHGSDGLTIVVQVLMLVMCTVHVRMHLHNHKTGLIHKLCNFILILEAAREQDDIILSVTYAIQSLRLFVQITKNLSPSTKLFFLEHSFHKGVWEYSYLQKKHKYLLWPISYLFEILLQGFVWNFSFYSSLFENF